MKLDVREVNVGVVYTFAEGLGRSSIYSNIYNRLSSAGSSNPACSAKLYIDSSLKNFVVFVSSCYRAIDAPYSLHLPTCSIPPNTILLHPRHYISHPPRFLTPRSPTTPLKSSNAFSIAPSFPTSSTSMKNTYVHASPPLGRVLMLVRFSP